MFRFEIGHRKALVSLATFLLLALAVRPALAVSQAASPVDPDYLQFPRGKRVHKSCVHQVPRGAAVAGNGDVVEGGPNGRVIEHVEACKHEVLSSTHPQPVPNLNGQNGNVEGVDDLPTNGATWFSEMGSEIIVPNSPVESSQTIYLWVGMGNTGSANLILQPVLQYSISTVPGACFNFDSPSGWAVLNYLIMPDGSGYCGTVDYVNPGDTIDMGVWLDDGQPCDSSGQSCSYRAYYMVNGGVDKWLEIYNEPLTMNYAVLGSLEAYNVRDCTNLPPVDSSGGQTFTLYALSVPVPQWYSYQNALNYSFWERNAPGFAAAGLPDCGYNPEFTDEVHLTYHN